MPTTKTDEVLDLILDEIKSAIERRDHTWQDRRQTAAVILTLAEAYAWIQSPDQGHGSPKTGPAPERASGRPR